MRCQLLWSSPDECDACPDDCTCWCWKFELWITQPVLTTVVAGSGRKSRTLDRLVASSDDVTKFEPRFEQEIILLSLGSRCARVECCLPWAVLGDLWLCSMWTVSCTLLLHVTGVPCVSAPCGSCPVRSCSVWIVFHSFLLRVDRVLFVLALCDSCPVHCCSVSPVSRTFLPWVLGCFLGHKPM